MSGLDVKGLADRASQMRIEADRLRDWIGRAWIAGDLGDRAYGRAAGMMDMVREGLAETDRELRNQLAPIVAVKTEVQS